MQTFEAFVFVTVDPSMKLKQYEAEILGMEDFQASDGRFCRCRWSFNIGKSVRLHGEEQLKIRPGGAVDCHLIRRLHIHMIESPAVHSNTQH